MFNTMPDAIFEERYPLPKSTWPVHSPHSVGIHDHIFYFGFSTNVYWSKWMWKAKKKKKQKTMLFCFFPCLFGYVVKSSKTLVADFENG